MNRKQFRKQGYIKPKITVIVPPQEYLMLTGSGQHKDAGSGGIHGDAKQAWFDEEEDDEEQDY